MRAREPDLAGEVDRDGVADPLRGLRLRAATVLMMGTFPVVDGQQWKAQVHYLARHFRVVTIDPRGNGRSGRPPAPAAYSDDVNAADALAVLDATGTDAAFLVALCRGIKWSLLAADRRPERVRGIVAIAPGVHPLAPPTRRRSSPSTHPRWAGRLGGLGRLPLRADVAPSRTRPRPTRTWWLGAADRRGHDHRPHPRRLGLATRPRRSSSLAARAARAGHPRHRGPLPAARARPPARRAHRRPAGRGRGRRPRPARSAPGAGEHRDQGVRRHAHHVPGAVRRRPGSSPASGNGGPCGSARRSGWATCCGTSPSPGPCASRCPTWRSSGWPSRR